MKLLALLLLLWTALARAAAPPDLDAWVARAMQAFDVPGVAVAIVKDGRVEAVKGYGVRRLGDPARVDENTLFGIASNTKAFTAAALAMLVDEGKVRWDDPVQKHLPGFQLYDPWVTRELTVRDLLCHRTGLGLGAGDLLFWPDTDVTRAQVLAAARFIRPSTSMRSRYAYNNLMFVVAGEIIPAVTGKSWDDFIRERILTPVGMHRSTITSRGFQSGDNVAFPHSRGWRLEGELSPIPPTRDATWAAAAGIKSSAAEMAKWVAAQLEGGRLPGGKRLWSEAAAKEMWSSQTIQPIREPSSDSLKAAQPNFATYGLGWDLRDYRGRKLVGHSGGLTGMVTRVLMVPDAKLGVVILTNQEEGGATQAIAYHVLDHYLGNPPSDWIAAYLDSRKKTMAKAAEAEKKQQEQRVRGTKPSMEAARYVGEYRDPWYGKAATSVENGNLVLRMARTPAMVADLEHWHYDTFHARFRDKTIPDAFVTFTLDHKGVVDSIRMRAVSELADFSFDYHDLLFRPEPKPHVP
ncbi:MAG TPA: serine hydrolase [Bryobacteraceae bacterium]|nr:serine hydrolase [Bryobacteraceae bacterium]